jgi:hypothetical protein
VAFWGTIWRCPPVAQGQGGALVIERMAAGQPFVAVPTRQGEAKPHSSYRNLADA